MNIDEEQYYKNYKQIRSELSNTTNDTINLRSLTKVMTDICKCSSKHDKISFTSSHTNNFLLCKGLVNKLKRKLKVKIIKRNSIIKEYNKVCTEYEIH